MTKYLRCASGLLTLLICVSVQAQFYTVDFVNLNIDTLYKSKDPFAYRSDSVDFDAAMMVQARAKGTCSDFAERSPSSRFLIAKLGRKLTASNYCQKKIAKNEEKKFSVYAKKEANTGDFPSLNLTDSLFLELIKKRLNICMPLAYIHYTSAYGYRKDPFEKCSRFHDGIDMQVKQEFTYCMLPGRVVKVKYGNTGYGNHVIIEHGRLRTLYGHLEEIFVKEGTEIDAGTVIGLTGKSGRSTCYHLHLALHKLDSKGQWISVDPQPFIETLNGYINELGEKLRQLRGMDYPHPEEDKPLTIANLYGEIQRQGLKFPKIVLAQALLESGNLTSRLAREQNNLFGLRLRNGRYASFDHWSESVTAYRDWVQYKHRPKEDYYKFLSRIRYAADSYSYINKVKRILKGL